MPNAKMMFEVRSYMLWKVVMKQAYQSCQFLSHNFSCLRTECYLDIGLKKYPVAQGVITETYIPVVLRLVHDEVIQARSELFQQSAESIIGLP